MTEIIDTTGRTPSTIAAEIRFLDRQAATTCIQYIIEIGRRLVEAKAMVGDGNWLQYIREELNYERSTAQNYMKLYERFGTGQASMFGSFTETQTFGSLTYTKALALLQVPEEDLEEFAAEHDIESMSTRELKQAIKERDEAIRAKEDASQLAEDYRRERDANIEEAIKADERASQAEEQVVRLTAGMTEAADKLEAKDEEMEKLRHQLKEAEERVSKAKEDLKKAKEEPDIPKAMMDQLRAEAEADAAQKAMEKVAAQLDEADRQKKVAQEALQQAQERLTIAQKEAQMNSPGVAVFRSVFGAVQADFDRLLEALADVRKADPETAVKLTGATRALLSKLAEDIGG